MGLARARITIEHTGRFFEVMFNPEEYTLSRENNFASQAVPGLSSPLLQFVHGNLRTLEMELFFDTFEQHRDVREVTQTIVGLLDIDPELHAPPVLRVAWASLQFRCVLARASQKYILFFEDGRPARARLTVSFQEYVDPGRENREVRRQTASFSKAHAVVQGETLSAIAGRFYQDPTAWRPIAIENGLDDPRALVTGRTLLVPPLPFLDPENGEVLR
ncbi:MAG TPA: LysM peptidoglycan-binding domain-containing protein [Thermoanaerobaculia bacterium]|jgi:LysM repeat protein|nr:LysM peptidoglycan-binding domain-containing protein [Thermoanaerobaculia bacterium]